MSIKKLFTNPSFVLLFLYYGGCIGYTTAISTKIEQILCAYGYENEISGLAGKSVSRIASFSMRYNHDISFSTIILIQIVYRKFNVV